MWSRIGRTDLKHHCLTNDLIKVAKLEPKLASAVCDEAHEHLSDHTIAGMSLHGIIRDFGGAAAANVEMKQAAYPEELKRTYPETGSNSPRSTEKSNTGKPDIKVPVSGYESYSQCVEGMINDLSVDRSRAETECATHFGGAETSSNAGKKTANRKTAMKTSKTIQMHNASANMEGIAYGRHLRSKDVEAEIEIPSWAAATMIGGLPNLRSGSRIRSAREQGDDMLYAYMQAREISHPDDVSGNVEYNPQIEEMIQKKAALLETYAEIHRLKQAAKKTVQEEFKKPAWAICSGL